MHKRKWLYILSLAASFLLFHGVLFGQYTSVNGYFEVDQIRGCVGLTVNITNNSGIDCGTVGCDFDYKGDGYNSPPSEDIKIDPFTFTYDEAGTFDLYILFGTIEDYITITVEDKPEPTFEVFTCAGNGVSVRVTDTDYDEYAVDFGDGSPQVFIPQGSPEITHTYAGPATQTISVQGRDNNSANNCTPSTRSFTPVAALPAAEINTLTITAEDEITLGLGTAPDVRYRLYISTNGGTYNILRTFGDGRSTEVIDLPFLANNYYCFRLDAIDPCGGPTISSDEVCSIRLRGNTQNNANQLIWETSDPTSDFEIYRDGALIANVPPGARTYSDTDVICGTTYCYTIMATSGIAQTRSREFCITADNSLPPNPVDELSTVPDGNAVILTWLYDDPSGSTTFDIFRSTDVREPVKIGSTNELTFTDNEAINPGFVTYCYEVIPIDACENRNFNNEIACVVRTEGTISLRDEVELSWSAYDGYASGVSYYSVQKSYDGINFTEETQTTDTVYMETDTEDSQIIYYRIQVVSNNPMAGFSESYVVRLIKSNQLFYPEAFSPDGDGLNDSFAVNARYVTEFRMDVFNKWGELIYHSDDIGTEWDGTYRGEKVPQGTYVLKLMLVDEAGQQTTQESSIFVVGR